MDKSQNIPRSRNPRQNANFLSILTFSWTFPIFIKGFRRDLEEDDLYEPLAKQKSSTLGDKLEKAWKREEASHTVPSLWKSLARVFIWEFLFLGFVLLFMELVLKICQPIALAQLITYYTPNQTDVSDQEAYIYAGIIVASSFLNVLIGHSYMLVLQQLGMKVRVACSSLIYRKSLRLSKTALGDTTIGQLVNLLSNDVNKFDFAVLHMHSLWVAPLEAAIVLYLLYLEVGWTGCAGVCFLFMFIPLQMYLGKRTSAYRLRTAFRTDERVRLVNEIISGIQVIKMYTWEKPFTKLIAIARGSEMKQIRATSYIRGLMLSLTLFTTRFAIFLCILSYVMLGNVLHAKYVFVVTSFYNILRQALTIFFPQGITQFAEALVSVKRLRQFLLYEEIDKSAVDKAKLYKIENGVQLNNKESKKLLETKSSDVGITLSNVTAKWTSNVSENTLSKINLKINRGQLIAVVGQVGSGKTSLLHVILKELSLTGGSVEVTGKVSYASQEPWIFASSVKQNILFGQPMNIDRYQEVTRVCALERDLILFPYGDRTIVGDRGATLSGGQKARINLARTVYYDADIYLLDDPLSAVDAHVGKQLFDECISGFLANKCTILVTHQLQYLKSVHKIFVLEHGAIVASGTYQELLTSGLEFAKQFDRAEDEEAAGDVIDVQQKGDTKDAAFDSPVENKEHKSKGSIKGKVYRAYLKSGGKICAAFFVLSLFVFSQLSASGCDYFIAYWANLEQKRTEQNITRTNGTETVSYDNDLSQRTCIIIYSIVISCTVILTLFRSYSFFSYCVKASINLHNSMFSNVVNAPMIFFNTNPSGVILNRFSKDIGSIDELLPSVLIDCIQIGLTVVGVSTVVALVNQWLLVPTGIIVIAFYLLRVFYLSTSRSVKRLEGTTKSPVFSHINATLRGLTTIRAFRAQDSLKREFDSHQDLHTSAFFMFLACSRAFGYWLDIICVMYIATVTFSFFVIGHEKYGGNVGLAITQAIGLMGMFQWGMRQWSELENQMTSVERVVEYTDLQQEEVISNPILAQEWPQNGTIQFRDVSLRYSQTDSYVLTKLNVTIEAKQKIGIVGRTGAGKSSLITALFQLTQTEGEILIDGIDTKTIPLHILRSKISIIPQEPILFSGTLRKNLDPFDEYPDNHLWNALEEVELKGVVLELHEGLSSRMSEGGSNFSVGQRQLLCLARAIIRNNKILVLDEATANVDPQTDSLIQETIRRKFAECTVLTIAHRLHTVMDSDKVLVMDAGKVMEFDHPYVLLQNEGVFFRLVQQTGKAMADTLLKIAQTNFKSAIK